MDHQKVMEEYYQGYSSGNLARKYGVSRQRIFAIINKEKARCYQLVKYAVDHGQLQRKPCEVCGDLKVEAHHKDYTKPLDVIWLCIVHHREAHKFVLSEEDSGMEKFKGSQKVERARLIFHVQVLVTESEYQQLVKMAQDDIYEGKLSKLIRMIVKNYMDKNQLPPTSPREE